MLLISTAVVRPICSNSENNVLFFFHQWHRLLGINRVSSSGFESTVDLHVQSDLVSNLLAKCWTNEYSIWKLYIRTTGWRNNVKKMIEVINSGNFSVQLWKESLKRIQTCTWFKLVPLRYRCSSLPIDLTSLLEADRDSRYCRDWLAVPRDSARYKGSWLCGIEKREFTVH